MGSVSQAALSESAVAVSAVLLCSAVEPGAALTSFFCKKFAFFQLQALNISPGS